eukprot:g83266.t1
MYRGPSRKARVLVVDDNSTTRKLLCRLLQRAGFTATAVEGGQEALDKLGSDKTQPDIVVLDQEMPGMGGPETARGLRSAGYRGLLIGVSGNHTQQKQQEMKNAGADVVFVKPLPLQRFLQWTNSHLPDDLRVVKSPQPRSRASMTTLTVRNDHRSTLVSPRRRPPRREPIISKGSPQLRSYSMSDLPEYNSDSPRVPNLAFGSGSSLSPLEEDIDSPRVDESNSDEEGEIEAPSPVMLSLKHARRRTFKKVQQEHSPRTFPGGSSENNQLQADQLLEK